MADETKEYEADYAQNRDFLKNRKVSKAVCEVEGCSEKATYGERSDVHGCFEYKRCKRHKEHFIHFTQCKWTFDSLLKLVIFHGAVMTSPDTVESWAFEKVNSKTRISLTCPDHDRQYEQTLSGLIQGKHGCEECNGNLPWYKRVPELLDYITGQGYTLDEREDDLERGLKEEGCDYKLKLRCPEGHAYYGGTVDTFTGKQQIRCCTCGGKTPWSERVPELMDIITGRKYTLDEHPDDLKRGLEKERAYYKLTLLCPNGHKCSGTTVNTFTGKELQGCGKCRDSKTEKLVREWLEEEFSNKFEKAHPDFLLYPETGRKLELDLFCAELELAFEIDGPQHNEYQPKYFHRIREKEDNTFDNTNPWFPQQIYPGEPQNDRLFIHQQKKDRFIDKRCEKEGINLIRIDRRYYNHRDPGKLIAYLKEQIEKEYNISTYQDQ